MQQKESIWILEDDPGCVFVYQQILDIRYHTKYFDSLASFDDLDVLIF
ncbi:MAG: hypothetical protein ISR65_18610 [Bacteriovoracaceae bacterium]|nr:hypothetical protein [Bacteriovoracaceae bacterium]